MVKVFLWIFFNTEALASLTSINVLNSIKCRSAPREFIPTFCYTIDEPELRTATLGARARKG